MNALLLLALLASADVLPEGATEVGVFHALRYGVSEDLEVATHPLLDLLMPNVALKRVWRRGEELTLASRHSLTYPSGLFAVLAREGTGGILPSETEVPHIVGLSTEGLASVPLGAATLTGKLGLMLAARAGEMTMESIDLPVVYARTAAYRQGWSVDLGVDLEGPITGAFAYALDVDLFLLATDRGRWAIEQSGLLVWRASPTTRVMAGYKMVYGRYPAGTILNLGDSWVPLPLVDVVWLWP